MRELKLKYRSKEIVVRVAQTWQELTPRQFIAATRIYINGDYNEFLKQFYELPDKLFKILSTYQKYKLFELVEFIQDARVSYNRFFLQELPGSALLPPGDKLDGMCLQQFMMVDTFFSKYLVAEDVELLDMMIAYLYMARNERFVLSDREPDTVLVDIDKHLEVIKPLSFQLKYAVLINFILIKKWLSRAYVHLFPEIDDDRQTTDIKMQPVKWLDIFDSFVGDNIPYMDKYQAMACTDAFRIMNRKIREAKKI